MTNVVIYQAEDGSCQGFEVSGHSGYGESGSDIVCAGISAVGITAVLGFVNVLHMQDNSRQDDQKGLLEWTMPDDAPDEAQIIINTMIEGLEAIKKQHPDHVRITVQKRR